MVLAIASSVAALYESQAARLLGTWMVRGPGGGATVDDDSLDSSLFYEAVRYRACFRR
jgi:hypothetical protein